MQVKPTLRPTPQLAFGLIVILLGIVITLDNLDILQVGMYLRYWPVLFLALGVYRLAEAGDPPNYIPGLLFVTLGSVLLMNNLHFHLRLRQYWPLLLVLLGLAIISHAYRRTIRADDADSVTTLSAFALLSGVQKTCRSQNFRSGNFTAIMGGCEIDLRPAAIDGDRAVIDVFSFWGGIEIRVPDSWEVSAEVLPIMGGCDDHAVFHGDGPRKQVTIRGMAVMGGIEVRN